MIHYQLDYVVEEVIKNAPTAEQIKLKNLVGANYTKEEAKYIWGRVIDHKWYIGERLKRDVGLRVAAVDYVENFYNPAIFRKKHKPTNIFSRIARPLSNLTRSYFVAKSKMLSSL